MIAVKYLDEIDVNKIYSVDFYEEAGLYILHCENRKEVYISFVSEMVYAMCITYTGQVPAILAQIYEKIDNINNADNNISKYKSELNKYKDELQKCLSENNNQDTVDKDLFLETINYLVKNY
jgi:glutamine synthetase type III